MITDEQFEACRIAANESYRRHKNSARGQIVTPEDDWEWHFVRELIALAQQVKPLEVVTSPSGIKHAHTQFGTYAFCAYVGEVRMSLPEEINFYGRGYNTLDEAIEAANRDFQRRVLSCLVNGWTQ